MRWPGVTIGLVVLLFGLFGLILPDRAADFAGWSLTPGGFGTVAGVRIALGIVLLGTAGASRWPVLIRALGFLLLFAGVTMLFLRADRFRPLVGWLVGGAPVSIRIAFLFIIAIGALILRAYTATSRVTRPAV